MKGGEDACEREKGTAVIIDFSYCLKESRGVEKLSYSASCFVLGGKAALRAFPHLFCFIGE